MNIQIQKKNLSEIAPPEIQSVQIPQMNSDGIPLEGDSSYPEINTNDNEEISQAIASSDSDDIKSKWPSFLDFLLKEHPNIGSFLSLAYIGSVSADSIELKFSGDYRFQFMEVTKTHNQSEIIGLLREFLNKPVEIKIVLDANATKAEETNYIKQFADIPTTIDDQIEKEPIIQTILDIFDGELL